MGDRNSDVDNTTPTRKSGSPILEPLVGAAGFAALPGEHKVRVPGEPAGKCGAMSEQSADSGRGNEQVPQKLVHLVGTRDPSLRLPPESAA